MDKCFSLFKTKTLVEWVLFWGAFVLFSPLSQAEEVRKPCSDTEIKSHTTMLNCSGYKDAEMQRACVRDAMIICNGGTSAGSPVNTGKEECNTAKTEFNKAFNDFSSSCADAGMSSSDSLGCWKEVLSCNLCTGDDEGLHDLDCKFADDEENPDSVQDGINTIQKVFSGQNPFPQEGTKYVPDLGTSRNKFLNCPVMAAEDLDDWTEKTNDAKDQMRDLEKDLPSLQDEYTNLVNEKEEAMSQLEKDAQEIQRSAEDATEEIKNKMEEAEQELSNSILEMEQQYRQMEQQIQELRFKEQEAQTAYLKVKSDLDQKCHSASLEQIAAMRQQKQALVSQGAYTAGRFNNLLKQVGLDSKQQAQKLARKLFVDCRADKSYKMTLEAEKRVLTITKKRIDQTIDTIRQNQEVLMQQLNQARNEERLKSKQKAYEALMKVAKRTTQALENKQKEAQRTFQKFAAQMQTKQQEIQQAQTHLAEVKDRVNQLTEYTQLKRKHSPGGASIDSGAKDDAISKFNIARTAAHEVLNSCKCPYCDGAGIEGATGSSDCGTALRFLQKASRASGGSCDVSGVSRSSSGSSRGSATAQ